LFTVAAAFCRSILAKQKFRSYPKHPIKLRQQPTTNMHHKIGTATGIASILGLMLLASSFLTITQGISMGGSVFFIGLAISYALMMCQSTSFAELAGILPTAGAVYDYVTAGMGRFWGVTATLAAYVIVTCFASSAEVAIAGLFARSNFPFLASLPVQQSYLIGWAIVIICILINIRGIALYAYMEIAMSYFKYAVMVTLGVMSLFMAKKANFDTIFGASEIGTNWSSILTMVGFTLFLFVGAEYITPLAPEMSNPNKQIKQSLFYGLSLSFIAMLIFGTGIGWQVPNTIVDTTKNTHLLETTESALAYGQSVLGNTGKWAFITIIFIATVALINTLIASIPRILYGMALDGTLPTVFSKLHPKYQTPYIGILFIGAIPMVGTFLIGTNTEGVFSLILSAICSWIFFYILVNLSVILLRIRRPDLIRPYKIPFYPIPQITATIGLFITFFYLTPPFLKPAQIYFSFFIMLAICAVYSFFWIKFVQKKDLWKPVSIEEILSNQSIH
jgi:amino acid transporter